MEEIKNEKQILQDPEKLKQISSTGFTAVNGEIEEPYAEYTHTEKIELFFKMRRDPIISTSLELIKNPILTASYKWKAKVTETENTKKIIDYLEWTYQNLWNGFYAFKRHWAMKYDFGLCMFEPVFDTSAVYQGMPTWQLKKMSPIMLNSISKYRYDDFGNFLKIEQDWEGTGTGKKKKVELWHYELWYDNNNEEFGNIYGVSVLESIIPYFLCKKRVMIADVKFRERGVGVAIGTIDAEHAARYPQFQKDFERALATFGNSNSAFFCEIKDKATVRLQNIDGQFSNQAAIDGYNTAIFYNTQTQFTLSGVQSTGSRAAAEAQKSPFIARVNQELRLWDERIDDLNELIIQYSPFASVSRDEWPELVSEQLGMEDVNAQTNKVIETAAELNIKPDKKMIEKCYGKHTVELAAKPEIILNLEGFDFSKMSDKAKNTFSIELAAESYQTIQSKADSLITLIYTQAIEELAAKLEKNIKTEIKLPRFQELLGKLKGLYRTAYENGAESMQEEINKIRDLKMDANNGSDPILSIQVGDDIFLALSNLYDSTAASITMFLKNNNQANIDNLGGVKQAIIDNFKDGQQGIRTGLSSTVANGFTAGRSDMIMSNDKNIDLWEYTAILDKNSCAECEPFNGIQQTLEEWVADGLNVSKTANSLNPNCLGLKGKNQCRCQLIPVSAKR